jgi:hypothetical protein
MILHINNRNLKLPFCHVTDGQLQGLQSSYCNYFVRTCSDVCGMADEDTKLIAVIGDEVRLREIVCPDW